jgi:DNA-binding cell septation regulator SpoVG
MRTILMHEPQILKVIPFSTEREAAGKGVAMATLAYGPVVIRARLIQGERELFLSMPSRKSESQDKWYDQAYFNDKTLHKEYQTLAIELYHAECEKLRRTAQETEAQPLLDTRAA